MGIDAANGKLQTVQTSRGIERVGRDRGIGEVEGFVVGSAEAEHRRRGLPSVEGWKDVSRGVPAELLLKVRQRGPVVEEPGTTFDQPFSIAQNVPGRPASRAEDVR